MYVVYLSRILKRDFNYAVPTSLCMMNSCEVDNRVISLYRYIRWKKGNVREKVRNDGTNGTSGRDDDWD